MEKLRNLLFYGGAMPDVYRNCRDEIRKENLEKLFFFLSVEIVFLLIALAVCCAVKSLAGGFIAYIIALACALMLLCTVQRCQNSNIALSICAATDDTAKAAVEQLKNLKGSEVHSSVILSQIDMNTFRKLGVNLTCEPHYQNQKLYHN